MVSGRMTNDFIVERGNSEDKYLLLLQEVEVHTCHHHHTQAVATNRMKMPRPLACMHKDRLVYI